MIRNELISSISFPIEQTFPDTINEFLDNFEIRIDSDICNGAELEFKLKKNSRKIPPILKLALPEDAEDIVDIYRENYDGMYPYKEMEDIEEVRKMLEDPNVEWILFKNREDETIGCFTFVLDFSKKLGYIRGLMVRKIFQGKYDVLKAAIGSFITMYSTYEGKIFRWYTENRTAHSKSQYVLSVGGVRPIAFYPNKDTFFNKIESDIMHICYDKRALRELRSRKTPKFLPITLNCFSYSDQRYNLGAYKLEVPQLNMNPNILAKLYIKVGVKVNIHKFGYETIRFYLEGSDSFFEFFHTLHLKNIEKCHYSIKNIEELFVFTQKLIKFIRKNKIRYCEVFVSAYKPKEQKVFYDIGMIPRGYIPSWEYNKINKRFEDNILFNFYEGEISRDIKLIEEGKNLLKYLNYY